jgi:hypothetical protein
MSQWVVNCQRVMIFEEWIRKLSILRRSRLSQELLPTRTFSDDYKISLLMSKTILMNVRPTCRLMAGLV